VIWERWVGALCALVIVTSLAVMSVALGRP